MCAMSSASSVVAPGRSSTTRGDRLAETVVGDPDCDRVAHLGVELQHLLHLFGEDLFATGVDADRSPAQEAVLSRRLSTMAWSPGIDMRTPSTTLNVESVLAVSL